LGKYKEVMWQWTLTKIKWLWLDSGMVVGNGGRHEWRGFKHCQVRCGSVKGLGGDSVIVIVPIDCSETAVPILLYLDVNQVVSNLVFKCAYATVEAAREITMCESANVQTGRVRGVSAMNTLC
jgi:hypothetical protein